MNHDRTLSMSPFPDDDGTAAKSLRTALASAAGRRSPNDYLRAVAALCGERILVPVVATATRRGQTEPGSPSDKPTSDKPTSDKPTSDKPSPDKEAEMAVVMLQAEGGRRAMLAFSGLDSMQTWDSSARPVPVTVDLAARSAVHEGATALLVDVAGPHPLAIDDEVLTALAQGHRLVELSDGKFGWAMEAPQ